MIVGIQTTSASRFIKDRIPNGNAAGPTLAMV